MKKTEEEEEVIALAITAYKTVLAGKGSFIWKGIEIGVTTRFRESRYIMAVGQIFCLDGTDEQTRRLVAAGLIGGNQRAAKRKLVAADNKYHGERRERARRHIGKLWGPYAEKAWALHKAWVHDAQLASAVKTVLEGGTLDEGSVPEPMRRFVRRILRLFK